MKTLYGITSALVTPFNESGFVDLEKVKGLTEFLIEKGVNCLFPLGTTGEMNKLNVDERKQVAEAVVAQAANRVVVYIHVGSSTEESTIELAKHAHSIGADGIGIVTPYFLGINDEELEEYYVRVAAEVPIDFPVYLYNIPQASANELSPEVAQRIANRSVNVIGIKYSYPDFIKLSDYTNINDGNFSVLTGTDRLLVSALAMGCDGTVSGISGVYPEPFVATYKAYTEGNIQQAQIYQKEAERYCLALKGGTNMSYFKMALESRGVDVGSMKKPQLNLSENQVTELEEELKSLDRQSKSMSV
ncbi:dihydrodipicolinate synthase family protein [Alkalicoccobacillus porphyridii]|uniref:Dihydrodipicolinate synthase family protein n=1 Tax=Alkalicoccobacillus porphyridii TaxID=2597270 RepID=A0A554A406_9BACI|nr:dihydrodipicolinate synthase family protein [Alkalicoccobacillus porphyridii]TSB48434.1 dihydrodipicolinate synthase family protein [Alkalicoccobacillus porphyridii]